MLAEDTDQIPMSMQIAQIYIRKIAIIKCQMNILTKYQLRHK